MRRFSKSLNAVSESDTTTAQELQELKHSKDKNNPIDKQNYFTDSESTSTSSIKSKRRIKKSYFKKPVRLYIWNQPVRLNEIYTLTVSRHKNN